MAIDSCSLAEQAVELFIQLTKASRRVALFCIIQASGDLIKAWDIYHGNCPIPWTAHDNIKLMDMGLDQSTGPRIMTVSERQRFQFLAKICQ